MEKTKIPFFVKLKNSIFNFDKYYFFAEESLGRAISYFLKLMLIFAILTSAIATINAVQVTNKGIETFRKEFPEFRLENDNLILEGENKQYIKGDDYGYIQIVVNSEKENLNEVENVNTARVIAFLKDKAIIKSIDGTESSITYKQLNQKYNVSTLNKENILEYVQSNAMYKIFALLFVLLIITSFISYSISIVADILLLSIVGWLVSRIIGIRFKYKAIFNMSIYSLTLSIILYLIYIAVNTFTGFTVKYFEIAYNAIAYVYLITAMLMIKSDLIKQQIEVAKIVEEQKKINNEQEDKKEENEEDKKEDQKDDSDKKEKNEKKNKEDPTGEACPEKIDNLKGEKNG